MQINWHATVQDLPLGFGHTPEPQQPTPAVLSRTTRQPPPAALSPKPQQSQLSRPIIPPHLWHNLPLADVLQGQQKSVAEVADGWAVRETSPVSTELDNLWAGRPRVQPHICPKPGGQYGPLAKAAAGAADGAAIRAGPAKPPRHDKVRQPQPHLRPKLRLGVGPQPMGHANEAVLRAAASPLPHLHAAVALHKAHPAAAQGQQLVQGQPQTLDAGEMPQVIAHLMGTNRAAPLVQGDADGLVGSEQVLDQPFKYYWGARPDSVFFTPSDLLGVGSFGTVYR